MASSSLIGEAAAAAFDFAGAFLEKRATILDPAAVEEGGAAERTAATELSETPNISERPRAGGAAAAREAIARTNFSEKMDCGVSAVGDDRCGRIGSGAIWEL